MTSSIQQYIRALIENFYNNKLEIMNNQISSNAPNLKGKTQKEMVEILKDFYMKQASNNAQDRGSKGKGGNILGSSSLKKHKDDV